MFKLFFFITTIAMISMSSLAIAETAPHNVTSVTHQNVATKTVTLSVPGMTCRVCPITVKKALESVNGVRQVSVNFDAKTATVIFNPQQANVSELTKATKKSGYPSTVKKQISHVSKGVK